MENPKICNPERLVYWYLRLNGFFLIENFIIHPDEGTEQRTDADLAGIRFQYRQELIRCPTPIKDDEIVFNCSTFCNVIIAEVKTSHCALNGPWTNAKNQNMHRILQAIGCFQEGHIEKAADAIYKKGRYQNGYVTCRLLAFGDSEGKLEISDVPQILFDQIINFIHERFRTYRKQKSSVGNWPKDGQRLKELAGKLRDPNKFNIETRNLFGLHSKGSGDGK